MTAQLVLQLAAATGSGFVAGAPNRSALALVERWPAWRVPLALIHGPEASGKSRLAGWWTERAQALRLDAASLGELDLSGYMREPRHVAIEDLGPRVPELTLLHLVNAAAQAGCSVLVTARQPPAHWRVALPDLRSRLLAAETAAIEAPDDELLVLLLHSLFAEHQVHAGGEVVDYLATRMERSYAAARDLVARLDREALARGRRITVPFVREIWPEPLRRDAADEGNEG